MQSAGWQPAERTAANSAEPVSAAGNRSQSRSDERATSESSARRRYRTAKERRPVEANSAANKSQNSFDETSAPITERDLTDAQTPFHTEN
jgi:hypothetical protein